LLAAAQINFFSNHVFENLEFRYVLFRGILRIPNSVLLVSISVLKRILPSLSFQEFIS